METWERFTVLNAEGWGSVGELRTQGLGVQPGGDRRPFLTGVLWICLLVTPAVQPHAGS